MENFVEVPQHFFDPVSSTMFVDYGGVFYFWDPSSGEYLVTDLPNTARQVGFLLDADA